MRKIQERRQKHSGEKGGAQGQRDGYIGVETQTRALGAEIGDQIPSTKLTDLGDPSPVTWSPDRAEVVLRAGCSHQLPPDHWFGPRVGENHSTGALGLGLTLGTTEGLGAEVGGSHGDSPAQQRHCPTAQWR